MYSVLAAAAAGGISALAFAPWSFWPAIPLALLAIFRQLDAVPQRTKIVWLICFGFGFGHFAVGLYWVSYCYAVDLERFIWMVPLTMLGIPLVLSGFAAAPLAIAHLLFRPGLPRALAFALVWTLSEILRSHPWCIHFPWNLWGHMALSSAAISQFASVAGTFGLSFIVALLGALPTLLWTESRRTCWMVGAGATGVLCALIVWGDVRLQTAERVAPERLSNHPRIMIIQPNISQHEKWRPEYSDQHFETHLKLMQPPAGDVSADIVIWPEAAISWYPRMIQDDPARRARIAAMLKPGAILLTGANRMEAHTGFAHEPRFYNSLIAIDSHGRIQANYDKQILLPFGEYIPFRAALATLLPLGFVRKFTHGMVDFTPGQGSETLKLENIPKFAPLICSETLYDRPHLGNTEWLVGITNDGWFGDSPGPHQHLTAGRMRALETGRPLVHCANTGISAVVDGFGRVIKSLGVNQAGVIQSPLPPAYEALYPRVGRYVLGGILGLALIFALELQRRRKFFSRHSA